MRSSSASTHSQNYGRRTADEGRQEEEGWGGEHQLASGAGHEVGEGGAGVQIDAQVAATGEIQARADLEQLPAAPQVGDRVLRDACEDWRAPLRWQQHWPRHCLRQDVPVRRAQRHRPGRQRYLEVDEPGGLEEKGSPCLLVQAPQCFGCYIQTVYRS